MKRSLKLGLPMLAATTSLALMQAGSAIALSGGGALLTSGATATAAATGTRSVVLTLAPRDAGALGSLASNPAAARLAKGQFLTRFAPSSATVKAIESWATAAGLRVTGVSPDRLLISVTGTTTALGQALGVVFETFTASDGSSFVSSTGTATLPASIAKDVTAIEGLSSLARAHLDIVHRSATETPGLAYPTSYGPKELWSLYNAPEAQTGSGQQVSVIASGDLSQPQKDLTTFEAKFGLPSVSWHQIDIGTPSKETEGDDEWDLDTQYSTGFAPGVKQVNIYDASSMEDPNIAEAVDRWVSEDATPQASFSAGECELLADESGFTTTLDAILAEAAAQGQTLFSSSGDTGSQCPLLVAENGVPLGLPGVNYPASSPYAIGAGGTSVLGKGDEIGWYAGGGGTSLIESAPSWQTGIGGSFLGPERGVPDVSLDADPNSGFDVIVGGEEEVVGGTSASAPSWQGIWARAEGAHGGGLGFAGPVIYQTEPAGAFNDIVLGDNGLFPCAPGWDYVTGRGTPDIAAFVTGA